MAVKCALPEENRHWCLMPCQRFCQVVQRTFPSLRPSKDPREGKQPNLLKAQAENGAGLMHLTKCATAVKWKAWTLMLPLVRDFQLKLFAHLKFLQTTGVV